MFFAFARRVALGAAVLGVVACSAACSAGSSNGATNTPSTDGSTPTETLTFASAGELTLLPLEAQAVSIGLTGADAQVQLWLSGEYADASLSDGTVTTSGGSASFTLHAPSVATTFSIFARAPGAADARLDVAVSASGFATVSVVTAYAGKRPMPAVVASVFVTSKCADLAGELATGTLADGAPSVTGSLGAPILLESVPAGSHLAVSVRVEEYAAGCVDLDALPAAATDDVTLTIVDRPMALGRTNLAVRFSVDVDSAAQGGATAMLDDAIQNAEAAFVAGSNGDADALLDAMTASVPAGSTAQFRAAREQNGWDATTAAWLGAQGTSLEALVDGWLRDGAMNAIGDVTAQLSVTAEQTGGEASLAVDTFSTLDATAAGVSVPSPFSWTADANDVVHLAGALRIAPTALVCTAAAAPATAAVPGSAGVPSALATSIDCAGLATALLGPTGSSYDGCDAGCTTALCATALGAMWQAAHDSSTTTSDFVALSMTTSAPATVDDDAAPASFSGAWVGQAQSSQSEFSTFALHGDAAAQTGATPPP
jgi:hypothetical protein